MTSAAYQATELERMLNKMVGDIRLKDLKVKFLVPSFRVTPGEDKNPRWEPIYFHNFPESKNADTKLVDAVLRTAAAPTYFPIRDGYVDGGVFANNPSLAAVTTAISSGINLEDISVFSVSTGLNPRSISEEKIGSGNWGLLEWGPHLIDLLLDSTTQSIDYQCQCLLKDKYQRLDPYVPFNVGLDSANAVPQLIQVAQSVDLSDTVKWIETNWGLKKAECIPIMGLTMPVTPSNNGWCSIQ